MLSIAKYIIINLSFSFQYGLYASLCGGIIYAAFGTIPELSIAPTALLSLLTFSYTNNSPIGAANAAILLCFLAGIIELACGILHLGKYTCNIFNQNYFSFSSIGFLVDFVSTPVVAAFTSAGAVTIASAQVKNLLGLSFSAETFKDVWINVYKHYKETKTWDVVLGLCCCVLLLSLRVINMLFHLLGL